MSFSELKTKLKPDRHDFLKEIDGLDPKANLLLKEIYAAINDELPISFIHFVWKNAIEEAYKNKEKIDIEQIRRIIYEAIRLLENKTWTMDEWEVHKLIKKLVIENSKNVNNHVEIEDLAEDVVISMVNFDFTKRVPSSPINNGIEDFMANLLNMVNEELHTKAISVNVIDSLLSLTDSSNLNLILTGPCNRIKYISNGLLNLTGYEEDNPLIGQSISFFLHDFDKLNQELLSGCSEKVQSYLKHKKSNKKLPVEIVYLPILNKKQNVLEGRIYKVNYFNY